MLQRWYQLVVGIIFSQIIFIAAFLGSSSPLQAAIVVAGLTVAASIVLFPLFGVFILSGLLIGQWPYSLITYLGLLCVASALAWLLLHQRSVLPKNSILYLSLVYLLLGGLSLISPKSTVDWRSNLLALGGHVSFVWLFATMVTERRTVLTVVRIMVFSGICVAIIGLIQWRTHFVWMVSTTHAALAEQSEAYRGKTAFDLQAWSGEFRVDSITGTPDFLPLYMQCLTPFVCFWIVRQKLWSLRLAGVAVLLLFALAHVLSFTRGALLTTAVVVFLTALVIDRKRLVLYGPIGSLLLIAMMLSWTPTRERILSMFELGTNETRDRVNTGGWRLKTIPVALEMISERPFFGVGLGQQKWNWPEHTIGVLVMPPEVVNPLPIHNDYMLVPVELGLGGLLVLLCMLTLTLLCLVRAFRIFKAGGDLELAEVSLGTMLAVIGLGAAMTMYPIVDNFRYFWLLLGLAASLLRIAGTEAGREAPELSSTMNPNVLITVSD